MIAVGPVHLRFSGLENQFVPGRHVTDHQMRLFMKYRQTHSVEVAAAKASIEKYFGGLQDRVTKATPEPKLPPPRVGRYVVQEPVELAEVTYGYRTPPAYTTDDPIVDVAMATLAGGKATRLYPCNLTHRHRFCLCFGFEIQVFNVGSVIGHWVFWAWVYVSAV